MPGDVQTTLARSAGQTVAAAAITDLWESVRSRLARVVGRGNAQRTQAAEKWLTQTHDQLAAASPADQGQAVQAIAERWTGRFADLLDQDPAAEPELRALVDEVTARLPVAVQPTDHSVAAGRDVNITASGGSIAAGVIHGSVRSDHHQ
jgi:hypothetical protein